MRRVSCEKEFSVLHRFDHKAAHSRNSLLQDRPLGELPFSVGRSQSDVELLPDALVGPVLDVFVGRALDVETTDFRRAHAQQGESTLVIGVDQLVGRRWRLGENSKPAEWIDAVVNRQGAGGNRRTTDSVKTVASS